MNTQQFSNAPSDAHSGRHSSKDLTTFELSNIAFNESSLSTLDKLENFPRFTSKRSIARFIAKQKIFEKVVSVNGIIVECGVFNGAGLFTWAHLTNIYEPVNYNRKIVGFDTFEGFPSVNEKFDNTGGGVNKKGDLKGSSVDEINLSIERYNNERHLSHIKNIQLVKGDFNLTAPKFIEQNEHIIVSLLYLDFDLYEPTKKALEIFLPRMPRGAVIAFDELNCDSFPGETKALLEVMGINKYSLQRFTFEPWISYIEI